MASESVRRIDRIPHVRDGVFFTVPDALPRGRHSLSRETIVTSQRERLLAAVTELLAGGGYRSFGVGDIASRAGVSLGTFYECFSGKDECVFAGYDRFTEVLLARMSAADVPADDVNAVVAGFVGAYLETLQQDVVVARAYQVEIDALGPPARERRRQSLAPFAAYIRERHTRERVNGPSPEALPWVAYLGIVYAVRQLASDALDATPEPDLVKLGEDLAEWLADFFRVR